MNPTHNTQSAPASSDVVPTPKGRPFHICLAGRTVCNDWLLIQKLKRQHQVTLVERVRFLSRNSILSKVDILVLDCSENRLGLKILSFLKKYFPELYVVMVDGGMTQKQIAAAFQKGVKDYFANPYDVELLVERLYFLGIRARSQRGEMNVP